MNIDNPAGEKNIIRYVQTNNGINGYFFIVVINNSLDKAYREICKFDHFDGFTLLAPESGSNFTIYLEPGQSKCVVANVERERKEKGEHQM